MESSENGNLILEQYGRFKRMELEKSPFHFLLANESHIDPNPHQINAFCAAIDAMKTGGMVLADEVGLGKTIEAGLVLRYVLESGAKKVLIALPASLRKQWELELEDKFDLKLSDIVRPILTFQETEPVSNIWEKLLAKKEHISIIIDEYGCFRGIVTMEDVIETMLGTEIVDEKDKVTDMQEFAREKWQEQQEQQRHS